MMSRKKSRRPILYLYSLILKKTVKFAPFLPIAMLFSAILNGAAQTVTSLWIIIYLNRMEESGVSFGAVLYILIGVAAFRLFQTAYSHFDSIWLRPKLTRQLHYAMQTELLEKAAQVEISCYDDPEFYDQYVMAVSNADSQCLNAMDQIANVISSAIYLFSIMATFTLLTPKAAVLTAILTAWHCVRVHITNKYSVELYDDEEKADRRISYFNRIHYLHEYAAEMRLHGAAELISEKYGEAVSEREKVIKKYALKDFIYLDLLGTTLADVFQYLIILITLADVFSGNVGIGSFLAVITLATSVRGAFYGFISDIGELPRTAAFIEKYISFLTYEPKIKSGDKITAPISSLCADDLSFAYQGDDLILKHICCTIRKGEKVAIVGRNGSGKSTFLKLLLRYYGPTCGEIRYNGEPLPSYDLGDYRARFGVSMQDFRLFAIPLSDNIMRRKSDPEDRDKILRSLDKASFNEKLKELPLGIETPLSGEYDENGTFLSGGEAQKVALARATVLPFDILLMDEPSAALDPISEYEVNQMLFNSTQDQTLIVISHRLSTTAHMDRIIVLDDGVIAEEGTHAELMEHNGIYAAMYKIQAEKFTSK